jgi:O-methyltransferase involved in polyketide biosynthesis
VSMYLTKEANADTLRRVASLAPGTTLAMTFQLPLELVALEDRPGRERALKGAQASGTPFISFFTPQTILALAQEAGFGRVRHFPGAELARRYFTGRTDGLRPSSGEDFLVATV